MKIVKPSVEILEYPDANDKIAVYKFLEKIGRTCYKSEDRITEDSCIKFIDQLIMRRHTSVLEHFTYVTELSKQEYYDIKNHWDTINPYNRFVNITRSIKYYPESLYQERYLMSFSIASKINLGYYNSNDYLTRLVDKKIFNCYNESNKVFLTQNEIENSLTKEEQQKHRYLTVKFICDRGIMAELTRHRIASFSVESTRYANYSLDKFGNEITVISPFDNEDSYNYNCWKVSCENAEYHYLKLLDLGEQPQIARAVLPNSLKTEVVMTAPLWSWKHFFNLRMSAGAHPQMQGLVKDLYEKLQSNEIYKNFVK